MPMLKLPAEESTVMASWLLTCKQCSQVFTHSQVSQRLVDYFFSEKPTFPQEGLERECPNCKTKAVYQRNELKYER
jgi:hypothetical protein